jgi:hypothetical protein
MRYLLAALAALAAFTVAREVSRPKPPIEPDPHWRPMDTPYRIPPDPRTNGHFRSR